MVNWPERHLLKQVDRWNQFDENIKLIAEIGQSTNFLDLHIRNDQGQLVTKVYHKPSYELYYLPFNSIHPMHMKKNIPFAMFLRAIRYCSSFYSFVEERASLRTALLLNKYPNKLIEEQLNKVMEKFQVKEQLTIQNYDRILEQLISSQYETKLSANYEKNLLIHFTYCSNMRIFPIRFMTLWKKYLTLSPINDINPILGTRNVNNLQLRLI